MSKGLMAQVAAGACLIAMATPAQAQTRHYLIPPGNLKSALEMYARQSGNQVIYKVDEVRSARSRGVRGALSASAALDAVLQGSGFTASIGAMGATAIVRAQPQAGKVSALPPETDVADGAADSAEIIVMAQKRAENVLKVPVSITVASANDLKERNAQDASQLVTMAPSLQLQGINNSSGALNFSVRGVGTATYSPSIESAVSTVIDGVAMGRPEMGIIQFFDIDHVEVLNGPQGMLFGKNASAGLIHIVTKRPVPGRTEAETHLSYGNFNEFVGQAVVNLPVGADGALRVSGFFSNRDSGIEYTKLQDKGLGQVQYGGHIKLLLEPTDNFEFYLSGDYTHGRGAGPGVFVYGQVPAGTFIAAQNAADNLVAGPRNTKLGADSPFYASFNLGGVQAEATLHLGDYSLTNIAAFRTFNQLSGNEVDLTSLNIFNQNDQGVDDVQFSNELRLSSPTGGTVEFVAGLYFFASRYINDLAQSAALMQAIPPGNVGYLGTITQFRSKNVSEAAFGQMTYRVADNFRLLAGGRLTHDWVWASSDTKTGPSALPLYPLGGGEQRATATNFSYRVGAQLDVGPDVMAYATHSRGYKGPGFNQFYRDFGVINPEIPTSFEVGIKGRTADRSLTFELSAYHTVFKGYQAQVFDVPSNAFKIKNAGSLRVQGVEGNITFRPRALPGLSLSANGAYSDAIYRQFSGIACYPGQTQANGCDPVTGLADASGNPIVGAPKWTISARARYEHDFGNDLSGFIAGDVYHRSSINFNALQDPSTREAPYTTLGASLGVSAADDRWRVSIYGRNLTDRRVRTFISANPVAGLVGDPPEYAQWFGKDSFRTFGLAVDVKFGGGL